MAASTPSRMLVAQWALGALLVASTAAIGLGILFHNPEETALILVRPQDCLRSFDDTACRKLVAMATSLHNDTSPRFNSRIMCELEYGNDTCTEIRVGFRTTEAFVPQIAAIAASREGASDPKALLPVYFAPRTSMRSGKQGHAIRFAGKLVGTLLTQTFGGASISRIVDTDGQPLSVATVARLRRRH